MMGGSIWLKSKEGHGSTFHFTVIVRQGERQAKTIEDFSVGSNCKHMHILLVEDNEINQELACAVLKKDSHQIKVAKNGLEALEIMGNDDFDVVFMDVQMPEMDGLTATAIIRRCEKGKTGNPDLPRAIEDKLMKRIGARHIPIIAMTANAMSGDRKKCLAAGMDDYLTKPFMPEHVHIALNKIFNQRKTRNSESEIPLKQSKPPKADIRHQVRNHLRTVDLLENEQIDHLLTIAAETLSDNLSTAESALKDADYKELGRIAHSIKGSLLNLGLDDIAQTAKKIEINAKENRKTDFKHLLSRLTENLADLLERGE
jgi:CheY-like chemotaxis protein/HPt (histidine-containing phosphotransfer) domain-containing protein